MCTLYTGAGLKIRKEQDLVTCSSYLLHTPNTSDHEHTRTHMHTHTHTLKLWSSSIKWDSSSLETWRWSTCLICLKKKNQKTSQYFRLHRIPQTGCEVICGAPTTVEVKGYVMEKVKYVVDVSYPHILYWRQSLPTCILKLWACC